MDAELKLLGIDLGTTYSEAAYVDDNGQVVLVKMPGRGFEIPSVVQITDDDIKVGEVALNQWLFDEAHVVRWIKRSMGEEGYIFPRKALFELESCPTDDFSKGIIPEEVRKQFEDNGITLVSDATISPKGTTRWIIKSDKDTYALADDLDTTVVYRDFLTPVEISAEILKVVKQCATDQLGQAVNEVVITCPAYFNSIEVENTKRAGELAGFKVKEIVKEPVAAAVCFGIEHMTDGERVMVCDLGGGTYDATILSLENGKFRPIATVGERRLGGHDWTSELVELVADQCSDQFGEDPRNDLGSKQKLYEDCEKAKRDFARHDSVTVTCMAGGQAQQVAVTLEQFHDKTEYLVTNVVDRCEEALVKGGLKWEDINRILMVGGSSRLVGVRQALKEASGKEPEISSEPNLMVAKGAAIMARGIVRVPDKKGGLTDKKPDVERTIARNLGTRAFDRKRQCVVNSLIIPHGTETPVSRSNDEFEIAVDGQEFFDLPIVEFENDEDYDKIRNYRFGCLPGAKRGQRVKVTFNYDISGILTAEAHDVATGQELHWSEMDYREPTLEDLEGGAKPRWIVFALDVSYSMEGEKLTKAKSALIDVAREHIDLGGESCKIGIVSFSTTAEKVCDPTSDMDTITKCVGTLHVIGSTAMDEGLLMALDLMSTAPADVDRDIVLLTDGMPDGSRIGSTRDAATTIKDRGIRLAALGIGHADVDENYLKSLTPNADVSPGAAEIAKDVRGLLAKAAG